MFHQISGGVERQLGPRFLVTADVIGNFGDHIAVLRNLNQPANGNGARPYRAFRISSGAIRSGRPAMSGSICRRKSDSRTASATA